MTFSITIRKCNSHNNDIIMPSVIVLSVVMLNFIMLNAIVTSVVMLNVAAQFILLVTMNQSALKNETIIGLKNDPILADIWGLCYKTNYRGNLP